jgi:hypothetical protein
MADKSLTAKNIDSSIESYCQRIACVGESIKGKKGLELFQALKRTEVGRNNGAGYIFAAHFCGK